MHRLIALVASLFALYAGVACADEITLIAPGGIRSPFSDVPAAVYTTTTGGPGNCREMGSTKPVDDARITALYGSRKNYETKFAAAADAMLKAGFVTPSDAKELKAHPKP